MSDKRVTLVMTEGERDTVVKALDEILLAWSIRPSIKSALNRHVGRLAAARVGSWGKRTRQVGGTR